MLYKKVIRPILFRQDPEDVHDRAIRLGKIAKSFKGLVALFFDYEHPSLHQDVAGIHFRNPVGLAAGFDKDCNLMDILPSLNFGYEEVGSITNEPYEGNPKPRLKRLPKDKGIIVYYGLKNDGADVLKKKLQKKFAIPIGVSIAKTNKKYTSDKEQFDDWISGIKKLKDVGDYITINLSCPNTFSKENCCHPERLSILLNRIKEENILFDKPVFLKLSSDLQLADIDKIVSVCDDHDFVKGFVISNLGKNRSTLNLKSDKSEYENMKGGISGPVVKDKALNLVRHFYTQAGERYVIIGCGGIFTGEDAYEYIINGASLVQLITGMIYNGPGTIKEINKGLVKILEEQGHKNIKDAIGVKMGSHK